MKCPRCNGEGKERGFGCPGFKPIEINCLDCGGSGEIDAERLRWQEEGEKLRENRKARGITLREEAKRRGLSAVDLSDMEWGRKEPVFDV